MSDELLHTSSLHDRVHKNGSISAAGGAPNPRSCVTCRRRKVKCDKRHPCSNCARAKIECIFPGPGRAPRKSRKLPEGELMDRLKRLEGVVQSLNAQVEEHEQEAANRERQGSFDERLNGSESPSVAEDNSVEGLESRFGRLVVDRGRSRYINNSFWASLNNEVEDLKAILIEPSDDEAEQQDSPETSHSSQQQGFMFGYSSTNVDMISLHPPPEQARKFWDIYKENVDPLIKVLHIPSFEPQLLDAFQHPDKLSKGLEALMFAIYYGAVTSVTPLESQEWFGEDRTVLVNKYRFGLEQGLARANFLFCDEIIILQAFVVFLILLRRNDDARKIWTLTGLVVRIAQTLGIHRDGSHFNLPPFEIEMRRRLWWQVCILDQRASEDHGCDPTIVEAQFDTRMPLNINDADLDPDMKQFPEERVGYTDMTFCIIRFELASIFRRILYVPPGPTRGLDIFANLSIPEKEKWISECHQRLEDKYLINGDMTVPLYWVTATVSRLVMSKMWLIVYHPHQRKDGGASLPQETKDKLFITSLENIEYSILLETEARTMKWGWLFRTYVQWHAIAFLLSELCVRTKGEAVDRAWRSLEATAGRWWFPLGDSGPYGKGKAGCLWKPLRKLMAKAKAARDRELALERASQALRTGGVVYQDYPLLLQPIPEAPSTDQPNSKQLDSMLRPAARKLGELPITNPPSWAGSPVLPDIPSPTANNISTKFPDPATRKPPSLPKNFTDMSEFGLDYVIRDVMEDMAYDGTYYDEKSPGFNDEQQPQVNVQSQPSTQSIQNPSIDGTMNMTSLNGFTPNSNSFNIDLTDASMSMNSTSASSHSPVLDNSASMDWANWDDLVREYGMDTVHGDVFANRATHLGVMNWF